MTHSVPTRRSSDLAHEGLIQSRAQFLPQVSGSGGYSRSFDIAGASTVTLPDGTVTTISRNSGDSFSVGGNVSYQLGLFGEVGRGVAASRAQYEGAGYDYATVLISTEAEIARNYVLARAYQAQLANARRRSEERRVGKVGESKGKYRG